MEVYVDGLRNFRAYDLRRDISNGDTRTYPKLNEGEEVSWTVDGRCIITTHPKR